MSEPASTWQIAQRIAREAAWAPILVLVLHSVAGGLLGHEPYIDPLMHFLGGVAVAFFFRRAGTASGRFLGALTPLGLDLLAFGLACVAALFWEFGEFFLDRFFGMNTQVSLLDTMRDLLLGVGGIVLYLGIGRVARGRRSPGAGGS